MGTIGPITAQYIPLYERIGQLSPDERETADLLVAHEQALRDFAPRRNRRRAGQLARPHRGALAHMR